MPHVNWSYLTSSPQLLVVGFYYCIIVKIFNSFFVGKCNSTQLNNGVQHRGLASQFSSSMSEFTHLVLSKVMHFAKL